MGGTRYEGSDAIRVGCAKDWETLLDAKWSDIRHFVFGDRDASEWNFSGRQADGKRVEVNGCGVYEGIHW